MHRPHTTHVIPALVMCLTPLLARGAEEPAKPGPAGPAQPPAEWQDDAMIVEQMIREAVVAGVATGKKARVSVDFGGASQKGDVVSADEQNLVVSLRGLKLTLPWERIAPARLYGIAKVFLPPDAALWTLVGRWCAVKGLWDEADEAFGESLRIAPSDEARAGAAFLAERRAARTRSKTESLSKSMRRPKPKQAKKKRTGTETGAWRPFSLDSPWNTPVDPKAELDPRSEELVGDLATSSQWNFMGVNIAGFSIPVFFVDDPKTPLHKVVCRNVAGYGFDKHFPIPDIARPDPNSDRHMCIVDKARGLEWGMWDTRKEADGTWSCGVGAMTELSGTGVRPPHHKARPWRYAHAARASGFPLIAGLILVEEMKLGKIEHALAFAYPHCRSRYYIPPASTAQGTTDEALPHRGIPMGGRLILDPAIDVTRLGLSKSGVIIARALQEYGMICCDYSGAINLYADGSDEAQAAWKQGLLDTYEIKSIFDQQMLRRFRLLKMPEFFDNKN